MAANAKDLISAGFNTVEIQIDGVEKPVEVMSMTVDQAMKFGEMAKKSKDEMLLYASLIKLCCPAFHSIFWPPRRIKKHMSFKMMVKLGDKIMEVSGYKQDAVTDAVKD